MFVCFPISSCLPPLRVGLYHIMLPLFLCSQFILLPCHPIMCCANRVLLCLCSEWMMELSHSRTRVTVRSFIWAAAQVHAIQFGLWKVFSAVCCFPGWALQSHCCSFPVSSSSSFIVWVSLFQSTPVSPIAVQDHSVLLDSFGI